MATFSLATLRRGADLTPAVGVGRWHWPLTARPKPAGTPAAFTSAEHLAAPDLEQRVVGFRLTARSRRCQLEWRLQRRRGERDPRTDISQVELQLHGLRDAPRRGLHQLRREDRGADPRVRSRRDRFRAVLGRLPGGDRAVLLHATRTLAPLAPPPR